MINKISLSYQGDSGGMCDNDVEPPGHIGCVPSMSCLLVDRPTESTAQPSVQL